MGQDWTSVAIENAVHRQADPPAEPGTVPTEAETGRVYARLVARRVADDMVAAHRPPAPKG